MSLFSMTRPSLQMLGIMAECLPPEGRKIILVPQRIAIFSSRTSHKTVCVCVCVCFSMHVHIFCEMSISQVQYAPLVCVCGCVYVCWCKKRTYIPLLNLHLSFVGHGVKRQAGRSAVATNVWEKTKCSDNERACGHGRGGIQISACTPGKLLLVVHMQ